LLYFFYDFFMQFFPQYGRWLIGEIESVELNDSPPTRAVSSPSPSPTSPIDQQRQQQQQQPTMCPEQMIEKEALYHVVFQGTSLDNDEDDVASHENENDPPPVPPGVPPSPPPALPVEPFTLSVRENKDSVAELALLARLRAGSCVACYSYQDDQHVFATILRICHKKKKNFLLQFWENNNNSTAGQQQQQQQQPADSSSWCDLRRFKFYLVHEPESAASTADTADRNKHLDNPNASQHLPSLVDERAAVRSGSADAAGACATALKETTEMAVQTGASWQEDAQSTPRCSAENLREASTQTDASESQLLSSATTTTSSSPSVSPPKSELKKKGRGGGGGVTEKRKGSSNMRTKKYRNDDEDDESAATAASSEYDHDSDDSDSEDEHKPEEFNWQDYLGRPRKRRATSRFTYGESDDEKPKSKDKKKNKKSADENKSSSNDHLVPSSSSLAATAAASLSSSSVPWYPIITDQAEMEDVHKLAVQAVLEGTHVAVWWPGEKQYFKAEVTEIEKRGRGAMFLLEYDDGDVEWLDLRKNAFLHVAPTSDVDDDKRSSKKGKKKVTRSRSSPAACTSSNISSTTKKRKRHSS
jgi:hypothetical protein